MQETVLIRTVRHLRANDVKQIIAEKFNVPVSCVTCEGYYSFKVVTEEEAKEEQAEDQK